jgi:hypothetical protein
VVALALGGSGSIFGGEYMQKPKVKFISLFAFSAVATAALTALANHSWNGYHWARTSNPFTLKLGDNLSSVWKPYLATASTDWSKSTVLDTTVVAGRSTRRCKATLGRVEVCNATYGNNGWLGVASIWLSGSHITQGTVKLNDTYFNTSTYNTPGWRQMVTCQEVAHTFGLDHQDTNFNNTNLGTCMDYTNDPTGTAGTNGTLNNEHPNQHDYDELVTIYSHLDSTTTVGQSTPLLVAAREDEDELPREVVERRVKSFIEDLGGGNHRVTFVFWAPR